MSHSRKKSGRRGAALIYILAFTAVVLLIFSATFHSFNVLRQTNVKVALDLQERASALRIERPDTSTAPKQDTEPAYEPTSE